MPTQPAPYIVLVNDVGTVTIQDGTLGGLTSYPLSRGTWAPAVAGLRRKILGGWSLYEDVMEELEVNIVGSSASDCYSKLDTLVRLLDQADRWDQGENVSPTLLKYAPQGSTIHSNSTPLTALVLGRARGDETGAAKLPVRYDQGGLSFWIPNIRIRIMRRGLWTGATESASATAVANPALLTVSMPSSPATIGPLKVEFTGFVTDASGNAQIPSGLVFCGPVNAFSLQEGEAATANVASGATFASTADAAARASGGNVGRLDHHLSNLNAETRLTWTLPVGFLNATQIAVYFVYRNNGAAQWRVKARGYRTLQSGLGVGDSREEIILPVAGNPTVMFAGMVGSRNGFDTAGLVIAMTGGSGVGTLDIDTIIFANVSDPRVYTIALNGIIGLVAPSGFASKDVKVIIDNDPTLHNPYVHHDILTTSAELARGYSGDVALTANLATVVVCWLAPHGTFWTTQTVNGSATLNIGATVTRRLGYLVPQ